MPTSQKVIGTLIAAGWFWEAQFPGATPVLVNRPAFTEDDLKPKPRKIKTVCYRGHEKVGDNLYLYQPKNGNVQRHCRACIRITRERNGVYRKKGKQFVLRIREEATAPAEEPEQAEKILPKVQQRNLGDIIDEIMEIIQRG